MTSWRYKNTRQHSLQCCQCCYRQTVQHLHVRQNTRLPALFQDNLGKPAPERLNQSAIIMKQETRGWQCHQLDQMWIICTSLQTNKHASIWSLNLFTAQNSSDNLPPYPPDCHHIALMLSVEGALKAKSTDQQNYKKHQNSAFEGSNVPMCNDFSGTQEQFSQIPFWKKVLTWLVEHIPQISSKSIHNFLSTGR